MNKMWILILISWLLIMNAIYGVVSRLKDMTEAIYLCSKEMSGKMKTESAMINNSLIQMNSALWEMRDIVSKSFVKTAYVVKKDGERVWEINTMYWKSISKEDKEEYMKMYQEDWITLERVLINK